MDEKAQPNDLAKLTRMIRFNDPVVLQMILKKIHALMPSIPKSEYPQLDESVRRFNHYWVMGANGCYICPWNEIDAEWVYHFDPKPAENQTFLKLLTCHSSGFVREVALTQCIELEIEGLAPYLLLRSVDWVSEIKELALSALRHRLDLKQATDFIDCISLINYLRHKSRCDQALLNQIEAQLIECSAPQVLDIIASNDRHYRRDAFVLLLDCPEYAAQLIALGSQHGDLVLRLKAFYLAMTTLRKAELQSYLYFVLSDACVSLRRLAILGFQERFPNKFQSVLSNALFDKSASIREMARFYLTKYFEINIKDYCKKMWRDRLYPNDRCMLVLSEVGCAEDFDYIQQHFDETNLRSRKAWIEVVFRLKPSGVLLNLAPYFPSNKSAYLSTLVNCIRCYESDLQLQLRDVLLLLDINDDLNFYYFVKLCRHDLFDRWQMLAVVLDKINEHPQLLQETYVIQYIESWMWRNSPNKVFTRLDKTIYDDCLSSIIRLKTVLPDNGLLQQLDQQLGCFSG